MRLEEGDQFIGILDEPRLDVVATPGRVVTAGSDFLALGSSLDCSSPRATNGDFPVCRSWELGCGDALELFN